MVMSQDQHALQNYNIYTGNKSFERMEHVIYLGTSLTNQNSFHEEIKCKLQSEFLLLFDAQSFVLQFAVQKCKGQDI